MEDPMIRINVRSEVGNAKYKLNDIPQVSEYIVKKLKSFIHRKVVYPHAHRFRLIWPRNWWPEGTEDLFLPAPTAGLPQRNSNPDLAAMANEANESTTSSANSSAAAPTASDASTRKASAKETLAENTSTNTTEETTTRKARTYSIIGGSMATTFTGASTSTAPATTEPYSAKTPAKGLTSTVAEPTEVKGRDSTPPARNAITTGPSYAEKFHQHVMKIGAQLPTSNAINLPPEEERIRLHNLKVYYQNHKDYRHYVDLYDYNLASYPTSMTTTPGNGMQLGRSYAYDDMLLGNPYAMPTTSGNSLAERSASLSRRNVSMRMSTISIASNAGRSSITSTTDVDIPESLHLHRHHSIADFRSLTLQHVLEQEYVKYVAANTLLQSMKATKNAPTDKHSIAHTTKMLIRPNKPARGSHTNAGQDGNEEKFSWFSKDGIQKAKAKFHEMKNKHFGNHEGGAGGNTTTGGSTTANVMTNLSTNATANAAALASKANKFGDKLTEMLFAEEGNDTAVAMTGSPNTTTTIRRRGSDDNILVGGSGGTNINNNSVTSSGTTRATVLPNHGNTTVQVERKESLSSLFAANTSDGRRRRNSLTGREEEDPPAPTNTSSGGSKVSAMKNMMANMFRSSNN
jgi:hypothetical protein